MAVYNNEETIDTSVNSILSQTYEDFEFLIVDDFSNDLTYEKLKKIQKKDKRIKLYRNPKNIGLTASLNLLISKSNFEYIARQDGDDISLRERLETQIYYLDTKHYDFCISRARIKGSKKNIPRFTHHLPSRLVIKYKNPFIHGTLMIKKNVMLDLGSYNELFYYAQDYKLFWDLLNKDIKFKYLKNVLYELNMENNISKNKTNEQEYFRECVVKGINPHQD
jgi:glycosyltransferase EpsE